MSKVSLNEEIWTLINKKWNLRILTMLNTKTIIRFNELKQSILGISANVLSHRLGELETYRLITKINVNDKSAHSGYILTEKCEILKRILLDLDNWVSSYDLDKSEINSIENSDQTQKLFTILKNETSDTEFNFIKDKLIFSGTSDSLDLVKHFDMLKNIILELYGDEYGSKIIGKLTKQVESFKIDI